MAAPTGLYEQVQANHRRSLTLFAMFALAFQLLAVVTLFLPLLLLDPGHAPVLETTAYIRRYVPLVFLLSAVLFAAQYWWFVGGVRRQTGFRYVDSNDEPRFCRILEPLAINAGIVTPYAGVIETPAMNGFACGVRKSHMVVVVTRGLIDGLDDDELAAILANAVTHIRNRDTRLLAAAGVFMRNMTVLSKERGLKLDHAAQIPPLVVFPVFVPVMLILGFFIQLAYRIAYGSRALIGISRELIADAEAVRLTHNPAALISALRTIEANRADDFRDDIDAMLFVGLASGPLATHPTIDERAGALARTTGSLALDTAQRLDTRPPEQRRAAGFGRKPDPALERIAVLAEEPGQRGFWGAFRSVRDPDRNIVGLNRRGVAILLISLVGIAIFYRETFEKPRPLHSLFAMEGVRQFAGIGAVAFRCGIGGLDATADERERCEKQAVEAGRLFEHVPGFGTVDGKPREYLTFREQAARDDAAQLARGCFPGRWGGMEHGRAYNQELSTYLRFASEGAARVDGLPPGPARDKALVNYAQVRVLMIDNSLHFFGESGLSDFNAAIATLANDALLNELGTRMKAPDFTATLDRGDKVSFTLLANRGTALRPCWGESKASKALPAPLS
jgi:Zn-dependent protease with chaperone function